MRFNIIVALSLGLLSALFVSEFNWNFMEWEWKQMVKRRDTSSEMSPTSYPDFVRVTNVMTAVPWTSAHEIAKHRIPILIESSPAAIEWSIFENLCTKEQMVQEIPMAINLRRTKQPLYVFERWDNFENMTHFGVPSSDVINMTMEDMLSSNASEDGYHYLTQNTSTLPESVQEMMPKRGFFNVERIDNDAFYKRFLRVSHPGTIVSFHYDCGHNFLVQVCGRKRLLLAPPHVQMDLGMYPAFHPRSRQFYREVSGNQTEHVFDVWEVVLEPKQALYIPPLWSHRVEAIGDRDVTKAPEGFSVSVNTVSDSAEYRLYVVFTNVGENFNHFITFIIFYYVQKNITLHREVREYNSLSLMLFQSFHTFNYGQKITCIAYS